MVDYCYNKLTIRGEHLEIQRFLNTVEGKDTLFDFNKLVPVPQELENVVYVGTLEGDTLNLIMEADGYKLPDAISKHLDEKIPNNDKTYRENAQLAIKCAKKYAALSWGQWRYKHWGTGGSATDTKIKWVRKDCCRLSFTTPATTPDLVIKAAVSQFPNLNFKLKHEMEDAKPDENSIILDNGEFLKVELPKGQVLTEEKKEEIKKIYLERRTQGNVIYAKHCVL